MIGEYCNINCMDLMAKYPDKHFDLAIVDPPYGIGINSMNMGSRKTVKPDKRKWDNEIPDQSYFNELFRVSKNQIIWGGNYFNLKSSRGFIIWDKGNMLKDRSFAECEFAWISLDRSAKIYKQNPTQLDRIHPTQKPVKLYEWILTKYAKPTDLILDTHVGSASSLIACENTGNKYVGCELDKDYYETSLKRLTNHCKQGKLFT